MKPKNQIHGIPIGDWFSFNCIHLENMIGWILPIHFRNLIRFRPCLSVLNIVIRVILSWLEYFVRVDRKIITIRMILFIINQLLRWIRGLARLVLAPPPHLQLQLWPPNLQERWGRSLILQPEVLPPEVAVQLHGRSPIQL